MEATSNPHSGYYYPEKVIYIESPCKDDLVSVVNEAVEYGIREGGISDEKIRITTRLYQVGFCHCLMQTQ